MQIKTMRGQTIDLGTYLSRHATMPAIGNARLNARGDKIAPGGKIIQRREDIVREYNRANPKAVRHVGLKSLDGEVFTPAEAVKAAKEKVPPKARKLTDE